MVIDKYGLSTFDCWLQAETPAEARALAAANVPNPDTATDPAIFDCVADSSGKLPPWVMIYWACRGPLAIVERPSVR